MGGSSGEESTARWWEDDDGTRAVSTKTQMNWRTRDARAKAKPEWTTEGTAANVDYRSSSPIFVLREVKGAPDARCWRLAHTLVEGAMEAAAVG